MSAFGPKDFAKDFPLSYENIGVLAATKDPEKKLTFENYTAFWEPTKNIKYFIFIYRKECNKYQTAFLRSRSRGYKIHISIFDPNDADTNLANAYTIFFRIALKHDISFYKIVADCYRELLRSNHDERGKEITIYSFKEDRPALEWQKFLIELTQEFVVNHIIPGPLPHGDICFPGSSYFSYRNDGSYGCEDPFTGKIDLSSVLNQPERAKISFDITTGI